MTLVAAVQLWLAYRFPGFLTGDEVEVLSEAFRVATDYSYSPWDARNTFVPDVLVSPFVWIATVLGIRDRALLVVAATIPFALATSLTIGLVHALARRWTADPLAAKAAAVLFALHWLPLGFGSTTYPRVIAMACIAAAALLATRESAATAFAAGALLGIAFADRYSEIVYLLPLLLLARRRWWQVLIGAGASVLLLCGAYDWLTWGRPFHSLRKFADLTLVQRDFASLVRHQPAYWYLATLLRWCALSALPLLWTARRVRPAWPFLLVPLVVLSFVAHKELRYLQGLMPFLAVLTGAGFAVLWKERRNLAGALLVVTLVWNLWGIRFLGRESRPAVEAAQMLDADPSLRVLALGQIWAYGDRIYLTRGQRLIDLGTPVQNLDLALAEADAIAIYESDLSPEVVNTLRTAGFDRARVFPAPRARDVVVFTARRSAR